ncbi:MAG TPA: lysophospholipid acyltransferase family protein [Croceibacterium sp.]|nr:lysophospholipid acyltransferase family protein [Croceibacterium sp.]
MRSGVRLLGVASGFLTMVPLHALAAVAGQRDFIPPLFLASMGRMAGLRVRTVGRAQPGALLLANHVSWLDILALAGASRAIFVAHSGLAGHGGLKWLCDQNRTVFITRDTRGSVAAQVEQVRTALGRRPLVIFPEATTNDGTGLLPFRSSLLSAVEPLAGTVPIQPVALEYSDAPGIAWFGAEPGLANVRRILARPGRIDLTIRFLDPLSGNSLANRKTMTAAAQTAIERALRL